MVVRRVERSGTAVAMLLFITASVGSTCQYDAGRTTDSGSRQRTVAIDPAYQAMAMPIVQQRITQAGIRLARLINLALDPVYRFGQ